MFFVQIDAVEEIATLNNGNDDAQSIDGNRRLILTLTDGITTVNAIVNDGIPHLE
jgi:hypothetical protein